MNVCEEDSSSSSISSETTVVEGKLSSSNDIDTSASCLTLSIPQPKRDRATVDRHLCSFGTQTLNDAFVRSSSTGVAFDSLPARQSDMDTPTSTDSPSELSSTSQCWTPELSVDSAAQSRHHAVSSSDSYTHNHNRSSNLLDVPRGADKPEKNEKHAKDGESSVSSGDQVANLGTLDAAASRRYKGSRYIASSGSEGSRTSSEAEENSSIPHIVRTASSTPVSSSNTSHVGPHAEIEGFGPIIPHHDHERRLLDPNTTPVDLASSSSSVAGSSHDQRVTGGLGSHNYPVPNGFNASGSHGRPTSPQKQTARNQLNLAPSYMTSSIGYISSGFGNNVPAIPRATESERRPPSASDIYVSPAMDFSSFESRQTEDTLEVLAAPFKKEFTDMFTTSQLASLKYVVDLARDDPHRMLVGLRHALETEVLLRQKQINVAKNWNKEFWKLVRLPDSEYKFTSMRALAQDFVFTSEAYGRLIISEMYLLPSEKTVHPLKLGGIAGGQKFVCQGILFKFAMDVALDAPNGSQVWMYGGSESCNEYAMKSAKHEFNSIVVVNNLRWQGVSKSLRVALTTIIDFRGFRLSCQALLPIGKNTLVYGSDNGGTTHLDDDGFRGEMKKVCEKLNIKGHSFTPSHLPPRTVYGPVDLEGHRVGKALYVVDLARLYPPESPRLGLSHKPRSQFFRLLRPELVRQFHKALSSDAHTAFGRDDAQIHNEEVDQATLFLRDTVIPAFAETLSIKQQLKQYTDGSVLVRELHRWGINLRYLGVVRSKLAPTNHIGRQLLLLEMVLRCLKNLFRRKLRKQMEATCVSMDSPYAQVVLDLLNLFLGKDEHSRVFWRVTIKEVLRETFVVGLSEEEMQASFSLKRGLNMQELLDRFQLLTGVKLIPSASTYRRGKTDVILYTDLEAVQNTVTKHMQIVDYAEGALLLLLSEKKADQAEKLRLLSLAEARLKLARGSAMGNQSLYQLGQVFYMRHKISTTLDLVDVLNALTYYRAVIDSSHDEEHLRVSLKHTLELYYTYVSNSVWLQHKLFGSELVSPFFNPLVPLPSPRPDGDNSKGPSAATSAIMPDAAVPLSTPRHSLSVAADKISLSGSTSSPRDSNIADNNTLSPFDGSSPPGSSKELKDAKTAKNRVKFNASDNNLTQTGQNLTQTGQNNLNRSSSSSTSPRGISDNPPRLLKSGELPNRVGEEKPNGDGNDHPSVSAPESSQPPYLAKIASSLTSEIDLFASVAIVRRTPNAAGANVANLFHQHCCLVFEKLASLNYKDAVKDASRYVRDACSRQGDSLRWIFAVSLYSPFVQAKLRTYLQRQPQLHIPNCPQLFVSKQDSIVYRFLHSMKPARKSAQTPPNTQSNLSHMQQQQLHHHYHTHLDQMKQNSSSGRHPASVLYSTPESTSKRNSGAYQGDIRGSSNVILYSAPSTSSSGSISRTETTEMVPRSSTQDKNAQGHADNSASPETSPRDAARASGGLSSIVSSSVSSSSATPQPSNATSTYAYEFHSTLYKLPACTRLDLTDCTPVTSTILTAILQETPYLQTLILDHCSKISNRLASILGPIAGKRGPIRLRELSLSGCLKITDAFIANMALNVDCNAIPLVFGLHTTSSSTTSTQLNSSGTGNHHTDSSATITHSNAYHSIRDMLHKHDSGHSKSKRGRSSSVLANQEKNEKEDLAALQAARDATASPFNLLRDMTSLNLCHCRQLTDEALRRIAFLCGSKLVELNMSGSKVSNLSPLSTSTSLRKLVMNNTRVRDAALQSFLPSAAFLGLFELSLARCNLSDEVFSGLSQNIQLRTLNISDNHVGDATLAKLSQYAPHLSDFDAGTVTLDDRQSLLQLAEKLPHLTRLKLVNAQNGINGAIIQMQKAFAPMKHLELPWCSVRDMVVGQLGMHFPDLMTIDLSGTQLYNAAIEKIKHCVNLKSLTLSWATPLVDPTIVEITSSCRQLTHLALAHCQALTSNCLATVPPGLTSLDISHCQHIVDLASLRSQCISLAHLNLAGCQIPEDRLSALFGSGISLKTINMKGCKQVSSKFVIRMAKYSPLLHKAILDECVHITETGLIPLLRDCPYLQRVAFTGNTNVSDEVILTAVESHGLRHLKELNLSGCKHLTPNAIVAIAKNCALLNDLSLSGCALITTAPIRAIAENCHALRNLNILGCNLITPDILPFLAQHCKVLERVTGLLAHAHDQNYHFLVE